MLDSIPYGMKDNWTFQCILTGKAFPFGRDAQSRKKATAEVQQHTRAEIERRERLAGRSLSLRELLNGIKHTETRSLRQQIADANRPRETPPKKDWAQQRLEYLEEHPGHDPQERARIKRQIAHLKRIVKQHEEEREAAEKEAAQAAAIAANPRIQDALAHSATIFQDLRFYQFATQQDVELAEQRHELAKTAPDAYWEAYWPWRKDWDIRAEQERSKTMQKGMQEIDQRAQDAMQPAKEDAKNDIHPLLQDRNVPVQ
ncbi:MAG: hypothetical protein ABFC77_05425 [Thermoguttaceae bacterium]